MTHSTDGSTADRSDEPDDESIDGRALPPDLAAKFGTAFGLATPPSTFQELVDALASGVGEAGIDVDVEALCVTEDSAHVAVADGEAYHFACVMDTFLLPALLEVDRVAVTSESPVGEEAVEMTVTPDGVTASPPEAVVSFGVHRDVDPPQGDAFDPEAAYARVCPYISAFPSRAAYERWAEATPEAVTIGLPIDRGFELAGLLVETDPFVTEA